MVRIRRSCSADNKATNIRIIAPKRRQDSAWVGGSYVASLSSFGAMWVSREEFDELGQSAIRRKCI